jgi:hypothetical protein
LGSECAFAYASAREELDRGIAREREELRELHRGRTWTDYVVSRAGLGDERALDQLRRWAEREERGLEVGDSIGKPEGREHTPPTVRTLQDLQARVDVRSGEVAYGWKDKRGEALRDKGDTITISRPQDRDAIRLAVRLAGAKWGDEIEVRGSQAFKCAVVEEAAALGVRVVNREMQAYQEVQRERVRHERERTIAYERGMSRGMGR